MSQNIVRHEPGAILSRAVEYNGMVFLAGLTADDYSLDIKGQTEQVLKKIDKYLAAAGTNKSRLISAVIYINKMANKEEMNKVWQVWMDKSNPPARACVEAQLGSAGRHLVRADVVTHSIRQGPHRDQGIDRNGVGEGRGLGMWRKCRTLGEDSGSRNQKDGHRRRAEEPSLKSHTQLS